jgi:hypothetical protein
MDSSTDLSAQILNNPELSQKLLGELVPLIYKGFEGDSVNARGRSVRRGRLAAVRTMTPARSD